MADRHPPARLGGEAFAEDLHTTVLPDEGSDPAGWPLAEWQGLMEELHYQSENCNEQIYMTAHDAVRWLVSYYLARRLNG